MSANLEGDRHLPRIRARPRGRLRSQKPGLVQAALPQIPGPVGPGGPADLSDTARNPKVLDLALKVSDPPTQAEVQALVDKVNELMAALRRPV